MTRLSLYITRLSYTNIEREEDEERRRKEREEREERGKREGVNVCGMSVCVRTYTCVGSAQGFMFEGEGSSVHFLAYRYASA